MSSQSPTTSQQQQSPLPLMAIAMADIEEATVYFRKSNTMAVWKASGVGGDNDKGVSLLKLAEENGLRPEFGCRSGACGTCETVLLKGKCAFISDRTDEAPEGDRDGTVLICSSVPGSVVVELDL